MDKMILIDLETQSFSVSSGIYEVACMVIENYQVVDELYLGKKIEGYRGETKYGFGFYNICEDSECVEIFKSFINKYKYPLVAHNCPFDRKFLLYYQWIEEDYPAYCSMRAIKKAVTTLRSYSLHNLVNHYAIADEVEHTAMSDTLQLYGLLSIIKPNTWVPVGSKPINKRWTNRTG
jgi:DNA polymerase III epsilon subunit-like protein